MFMATRDSVSINIVLRTEHNSQTTSNSDL
jgi:hypothetical protein